MSMKLFKRSGSPPSPADPAVQAPDVGHAFFRMEKINKYYQMGEEQVHILKDVDLARSGRAHV